MTAALALLEYDSLAVGILAVDRMLKCAPIAILKCGTVHPGRYLALVGGTVASTEEAWREGCRAGEVTDDIFLPDPHPELVAALAEAPRPARVESLAVVETATSPALLRAVDAALKAVPVQLTTLRLADDLGGRGLALLGGTLADVQDAIAVVATAAGRQLLRQTLLPRIEPALLDVLAEGSRFAACRAHEPADAEILTAEA